MVAKQIFGFLGTGLGLVGLYLVLTNFVGSAVVISSLSSGTASIYRTLQGR